MHFGIASLIAICYREISFFLDTSSSSLFLNTCIYTKCIPLLTSSQKREGERKQGSVLKGRHRTKGLELETVSAELFKDLTPRTLKKGSG